MFNKGLPATGQALCFAFGSLFFLGINSPLDFLFLRLAAVQYGRRGSYNILRVDHVLTLPIVGVKSFNHVFL